MEIFLNDSSRRDPRLFDVGAKLDHFTGQIDRTLHGLPSNPIRTLLNRIGRIPWFTNKKKKLLFSFFSVSVRDLQGNEGNQEHVGWLKESIWVGGAIVFVATVAIEGGIEGRGRCAQDRLVYHMVRSFLLVQPEFNLWNKTFRILAPFCLSELVDTCTCCERA